MVGTQLDFDAVMALCGDEHRRIVLATLSGRDQPVSIDHLVGAIVRHNHHASPETVGDGTETRIKTSLFHMHLPKLAAADLVEFDIERERVTPTEALDRAEPHLSQILAADPDLSATIEA